MVSMEHGLFLCIIALGLLITGFYKVEGGGLVGINYGMIADNLPPPDKVVALYKSRGVTKLRLFHPDTAALKALEGSGIEVVLGPLNEDLQKLSSDASFAANWVATNVVPHSPSLKFRYIAVGNEVIPGDLAAFVLPAMKNLDAALTAAGVAAPVTTAVSTSALGASYPPSQGAFSEAAGPTMAPIAAYLSSKQSPLLANVYPYFAYSSSPNDVRLDYALFQANGVVVQDGGLGYSNLFDAMVDGVHAAMEKAGGADVDVVVSETGWPSGGGGVGATLENASVYNNNLVAHVEKNVGTPKRPGNATETYLFAMFNENQKPAGTEQNFGLYAPDMSEVYHVDLSSDT